MTTQHDNTNVERAPKDKDNPYGMLRRSTFDGSALTFDERGVLAYILMKPDNWKANVKDLMREGGIGRDKTYNILSGLIAKGYAERVDQRDAKGHFDGVTIKIYEQPLPENPLPENPLPENPLTVPPLTENTEHNNNGVIPITDQQLITDKRKKKEASPPHPLTKSIIDAYVELIGYKPTPTSFGKIGKDAKHIAEQGHTPDDVRHAYTILGSESFWEGKTISLGVVLGKIENLKATMRNRREETNEKDEYTGGWKPGELARYRELRRNGKPGEAEDYYRSLAAHDRTLRSV